ncbi:hypothetical protein H5410_041870 [Solanum commersonii]|uniref:Uncharacterized protein n=1 Tax=Solanum commersonii TaxID=4109 RepID=A0A9J5XVV6_SOLCO|nr:hypothetical protein H5410_041870 [Solanum commersonii]
MERDVMKLPGSTHECHAQLNIGYITTWSKINVGLQNEMTTMRKPPIFESETIKTKLNNTLEDFRGREDEKLMSGTLCGFSSYATQVETWKEKTELKLGILSIPLRSTSAGRRTVPSRPPPSVPSTRQPVKTPSPIPPIDPPINKLREKVELAASDLSSADHCSYVNN